MKNNKTFQQKVMKGFYSLSLIGLMGFTTQAIAQDVPPAITDVKTLAPTADPNTFPATGNVGIGTNAPVYQLHFKTSSSMPFMLEGTNSAWTGMYVNSTNTTGISYYGYISNGKYAYSGLTPAGDFRLYVTGERLTVLGNNGFVGIGTNAPTHQLNVVSNQFQVAKFKRSASGADLTSLVDIENGSGTLWRYGVGGTGNGLGLSAGQFYIERYGIGSALTIATNGNVGIGTNNPAAKLSVNGLICAKEVRVALSGAPCWPDYVFSGNYKLKELSEVENFIKENKHLPGIPSANEVEKAGIELGDINIKLLEKIEELTLYMIDMKKENTALKARVESLEKK